MHVFTREHKNVKTFTKVVNVDCVILRQVPSEVGGTEIEKKL